TGVGWSRRLKDRLAHRQYAAEERRVVPKARVVVTTCERTRRDILDHLGARPEAVHVVYLGIDPDLFRPATPDERSALRRELGWGDDRPRLAFVGGLGNRRKGFDTLFAAWESLCRSPSWDADLVVVGRGAELPAWEERAAAAGLGTRIHFLGFR